MNHVSVNDTFKTSREIHIFSPALPSPSLNIQMKSKVKIGGMLRWMTSRCNFTTVFEKNHFHPGDWANVRIIADNSQCSNEIWGFKVKLI